MPFIRNYKPSDFDKLSYICCATTSMDVSTEKAQKALCTLYNDYYKQEEPQNVFVAVDDKDSPIGYIIAAKDFKSYKKTFQQKYLPLLRKQNRLKAFVKRFTLIYDSWVSKQYPSHLHIDILDGYHRLGLGRMLMERLLKQLKESGSTGVSLCVGNKNANAIAFYEKMGFVVHDKPIGCIRFVKKL